MVTSKTRSRLAAVAAPVVLALALSSCAGENDTGIAGQAPSSPADHGSMVMPAFSEPPASADWASADAAYLTRMIGHHRQALDMASLATTRANDPRVRSIAETIDTGQAREIIVMATWLVDHGLPEPTLDDVAHQAATIGMAGGMPGMLSSAQLDDLAAADGATFDRLFLEGMIQHHQGAVGMAETVLGTGKDVRVNEMAAEVIATQNGEINRMHDLLLSLP